MTVINSSAFNQNSGSAQAIATFDSDFVVTQGGCEVPTGNLGQYRTNQDGYNSIIDDANTYPRHQYSRTTYGTASNNGLYDGPLVYGSINTGYHLDSILSTIYVSKRTAAGEETIAGPISVSAAIGEALHLEVDDDGTGDTLLTIKKNTLASPTVFSTIDTVLDDGTLGDATAPLTSGKAGFFGYDSAAAGGFGTGAWEAGDFGGGGGSGNPWNYYANQ